MASSCWVGLTLTKSLIMKMSSEISFYSTHPAVCIREMLVHCYTSRHDWSSIPAAKPNRLLPRQVCNFRHRALTQLRALLVVITITTTTRKHSPPISTTRLLVPLFHTKLCSAGDSLPHLPVPYHESFPPSMGSRTLNSIYFLFSLSDNYNSPEMTSTAHMTRRTSNPHYHKLIPSPLLSQEPQYSASSSRTAW